MVGTPSSMILTVNVVPIVTLVAAVTFLFLNVFLSLPACSLFFFRAGAGLDRKLGKLVANCKHDILSESLNRIYVIAKMHSDE